MKKFFLLSLSLCLWATLLGATNVTYTADNTSIFRNPERGFTEELGGETMLTDSKNHVIKDEASWYFSESGDRETQTLAVVIYYLGNYKTKDLSDKILQGFDEDMQILRNNGFKCVLRFAYDWNSKNDASLTWVKRHISQLKPHLASNSDVIYVLEIGFVGQWGEWYYSSNFGNETQHLNDNRRAVVEAMLDACPANRFLLVRYPMIKTEYFGTSTAITSSEGFTSAARARMGHHNDAFLNDWGNDGTYASNNSDSGDDPAVRQFIADETLYVPNGGETNVEGSSLAKKVYSQAESEMSKYHWSFCGSTYAEEVTNLWRSKGIYDNLDRKMGYRFQLTTATLPSEANPGGKARFQINIKNVGYAPLYNERHAYIVLKNGSKTYSIQLQSDPRRWLPNDAVTAIDEQLTIPASVPAGTYQLYLHLPDASASIAADPRYAVRFANTGVWDAATGMNALNASIQIKTSSVTPDPDPDPEPGDDPDTPVTPSGEGTVIFHWQSNSTDVPSEATDLNATVGTVVAHKTDDSKNFSLESAAYTEPVPDDMKSTTGKGVKFGANALYFTLTPATDALCFQTGDTVFICAYNQFKLSSADSHEGNVAASIAGGADKSHYSVAYTVIGEGVSTPSLNIERAVSSGSGLTAIKVVRPKSAQGTDPDPDPNPDPDPDPQPSTDAIVLPATLNKANVSSYSESIGWYNNDYFDFGVADAENTDHQADWKVYLRYPKAYDVTIVGYYPNGHQWQLSLVEANATYSLPATWDEGDQTEAPETKWDLSSVPAGEYTLRVQNIMEWGQPKVKSITLNTEVPDATAVDQPKTAAKARKILSNGQILILRGDKTYTITGQECR